MEVSLIVLVLLLVPGLVGVELYYRRTSKRSRLSRIQLIVYSIFLSIVSIFILYLTTPIYFDWINTGSSDIAQSLDIVSESEISDVSLPVLIPLYTIHIILTLFLGFLIGYVDDEYWNTDRVLDRRAPWKYAFDETSSEEIEIVLQDGDIIRGQFNESAWSKDKRELYIEDPKQVEYDGQELISEPIELGRSLLIMESSISQVIFVEEDPRTEGDYEASDELQSETKEDIDKIIQDIGDQQSLSEAIEDENEDKDPS